MTPLSVALDDATIDKIAARTNAMVLDNIVELGLDDLAERIVERLRASGEASPAEGASRLVDARMVAETLGCSRDCVYAHADELGGQRIGAGRAAGCASTSIGRLRPGPPAQRAVNRSRAKLLHRGGFHVEPGRGERTAEPSCCP